MVMISSWFIIFYDFYAELPNFLRLKNSRPKLHGEKMLPEISAW
jgi:hypothetical protein